MQKSTNFFVFLGERGKANQCILFRVEVFSPGYSVVLLPKTPKFLLPRNTRFLYFSPEPQNFCIYWICYFIPGNDGRTTTIDRKSFVMATRRTADSRPVSFFTGRGLSFYDVAFRHFPQLLTSWTPPFLFCYVRELRVILLSHQPRQLPFRISNTRRKFLAEERP